MSQSRRLVVKPATGEEGIVCASPGVGRWRFGPRLGDVVAPGQGIGVLTVIGVDHALVAGPGMAGRVTERFGGGLFEPEVAFGDPLMVLDPDAAGAIATEATGPGSAASGGLAFVAPLAGRFYAKPAPDKPTFVSVGDVIATGQTVGLLEVMKTFNRMQYGSDDLPARAKVIAIDPADGDDLSRGDVILRLEAAD